MPTILDALAAFRYHIMVLWTRIGSPRTATVPGSAAVLAQVLTEPLMQERVGE